MPETENRIQKIIPLLTDNAKPEDTFHSNSPGDLDVQRLLANQAPWKRTGVHSKRKTLILADWRMRFWPDETIQALQDILKQLMEHHFSIHLWQDGCIEPLCKDNLDALCKKSSLNKVTVALSEAITQAAREAGIVGSIHVLDEAFVAFMLGEVSEPMRLLRTSEIKYLFPTECSNLVKKIASSPVLETRLIDDYFDGYRRGNLKEFQKNYPDIAVERQYERVYLKSEDDKARFSTIDNDEKINVTYLELDSVEVAFEDFPNLHDLNLQRFDSQALERLFQKSLPANLKSLKIDGVFVQYFDVIIPCNTLERIDFGFSITYEYLENLFVKNPNIKAVKCELDKIDGSKMFNLDTSRLEDLCIRFGEKEFVSLQPLICAKNLKNLELIVLTCDKSNHFDLSQVSTNLERIKINSPYSNDLTVSGLSHLVCLKELELNNCSIEQASFQFSNDIPSLETLKLTRMDVSFALHQFCKYAVNLKTIILEGIDTLPITPGNTLKKLEHLELSNCILDNLDAMLSTATNLKSLRLYLCGTENEAFDRLEGKAPMLSIKTLEIQGLPFKQVSTLVQFLRLFKGINELTLGDIKIEEAIGLEPNYFHSLTRICGLYRSSFTVNAFASVLNSAPKLKYLEGVWVKGDEGIDILPNALPCLKVLEANGLGNLSVQQSLDLLRAAPNLERVNLAIKSSASNSKPNEMLSLHHLQHLSLRGALDLLDPILHSAFQLQELCLENYTDVFCSLSLEPNCLSKLVFLSCCVSDCESFHALLEAAPNLKKLHILYRTSTQKERFLVPENSLTELEELIIYDDVFLNEETLRSIFRAAPNLRVVTLGSNVSKAFEFPGHITLLKLIQIYVPKNTLSEDFKQRHPNAKVFEMEQSVSIRPAPVESSSSGVTYVDPRHDYQAHYNKPQAVESEPFTFKNKSATKNQGMLIDKLCQYFSICGIPFEYQQLKPGICLTLSQYCLSIGFEAFGRFLDLAKGWDGRRATLTPDLKTHFEALNQTLNQLSCYTYDLVGDEFEGYLLGPSYERILANPWHAIAVSKHGNNQWRIYDPNYVEGIKRVDGSGLRSAITSAIGNVVAVLDGTAIEPIVRDPDAFLAEGGLLSLCQCRNVDSLILQLEARENWSDAALEGLFIYSNANRPAWIMGLQNARTHAFTERLLHAFKARKQDTFLSKLKEGLATLSPEERTSLVTRNETDKNASVVSTKPVSNDSGMSSGASDSSSSSDSSSPSEPASAPEPPSAPILNAIQQAFDSAAYEQSLTTWDAFATTVPTVLEFCQKWLPPCPVDGNRLPNTLLLLDSPEHIVATRWALESHCYHTSRPVYYLHSAEDLVCSSAYIERTGDVGILKKGPGGPLHAFLMQHWDAAPVLLVNYATFTAKDLVACNALLDDKPSADGTDLPERALVIGMVNANDPNRYQGSDFYSRFRIKTRNPFAVEALSGTIPKPPIARRDCEPRMHRIRLFYTPDWKARLLGCWVLNEQTLSFESGALINALKAGTSQVVIEQALWESPAFQRFWQETCFYKRLSGIEPAVVVPDSLELIRPIETDYDWDNLRRFVTFSPGTSDTSLVLNPNRLERFFGEYVSVGELSVRKTEGLIRIHAGRPLSITLTRALDRNDWARLLSACETHDVRLNVHCAPGVTVPEELTEAGFEPAMIPVPLWQAEVDRYPTEHIATTDIDTTVRRLTDELSSQSPITLDVSECDSSELLPHIHAEVEATEEGPRFLFHAIEGVLTRVLTAGKTVLLKGRFLESLQDGLADYLAIRQREAAPQGRLYLISDLETQFADVPRSLHRVSVEDKRRYVGHDLPETLVEQEPLAKLEARIRMVRQGADSEDGWSSFYHIPHRMSDLGAFEPETAAADTEAFMASRLTALESVLAYMPYVFITGLTGVGKSTFVRNELPSEHRSVYSGLSNAIAWAEDRRSGVRKYLFLDEANLAPSEWSLFEGLFHSPPAILYAGQIYPLDETHKVIFAGNPCSYGEQRTLAPLFERHGGALPFGFLPNNVLYHRVLRPVFEGASFAPETVERLCGEILAAYGFLCERSSTEVLISPRELQMIALWVVSRPKVRWDVRLSEALQAIAKPLLPKVYHAEFERRFPVLSMEAEETDAVCLPSEEGDFLITESRHPIVERIQGVFALREFRKKGTNDAQRYGGLGGMLLEGEPGQGKSQLLFRQLHAYGFELQPMTDMTAPPTSEKPYYYLPASMSTSVKQAWLLKAFDEGAVVMMDELNTHIMEDFLNDALMGVRPRCIQTDTMAPQSKRPNQPGFTVFATGNPAELGGRQQVSTALKRRLMCETVPNYTEVELVSILKAKGLEPPVAENLVSAYFERQAYARAHRLQPPPAFRDLMHVADDALRAKRRSSSEVVSPPEAFKSYPINEEVALNILKALSFDARIKALVNSHKALGKKPQLQQALKVLVPTLNRAAAVFKQDKNLPNFIHTCFAALNKAQLVFDTVRTRANRVKTIIANFLASFITLFGVNLYRLARKHTFFFKTTPSSIKPAKKLGSDMQKLLQTQNRK